MNKMNIKQLVKETLEAALNEGPDTLSAIESEADGLARGADVMIAVHERGTRLDSKAVGTVIKNKANKIKDLVQQHRAEMEGPHRGVADKPDDIHPFSKEPWYDPTAIDETRTGSPQHRAVRKTMTTEPDESANAHTANEIEDFISQQLIKVAGPVGRWTPEHLETFEQINNLLSVLFP